MRNRRPAAVRIISGIYKGRRLNMNLPSGIRPTQDAMRETIFNVLLNHIDITGLLVADVCAGAGMFGLEALSRGAAFVHFVDKSYKSVAHIKATVQLLSVPESSYSIHNLDALQFVNSYGAHQLPPAAALNVDFAHESTCDSVRPFPYWMGKPEPCCVTTYPVSNGIEPVALLFLDPPYKSNIINEVLLRIGELNIMQSGGIIVAETAIHNNLTLNDNFTLLSVRQYGAAKVYFIKQK